MTVAELRAGYRNKGMSRRQFGEHIGLNEATLRRMEAGLPIAPANAKKVADHFGCLVTDLPGMAIEESAA